MTTSDRWCQVPKYCLTQSFTVYTTTPNQLHIQLPYRFLMTCYVGLIWHSATKATAKVPLRIFRRYIAHRCSQTRNPGWAWEDHFLIFFFSFLYYFSHFPNFPFIFFLNLVLRVRMGKVTTDAVATVIVHTLEAAYPQQYSNYITGQGKSGCV